MTLPQSSESQRLADVTGSLNYQAKPPLWTIDTWPDVVVLAAAIGRKLCRDSSEEDSNSQQQPTMQVVRNGDFEARQAPSPDHPTHTARKLCHLVERRNPQR